VGTTIHKGGGIYAPRCTRYLKPQINAVNDSYDLVLFTIGGNDAGFGDIASNCLTEVFGTWVRDGTKCRTALGAAEQLVSRSDSRSLRSRTDQVLSNVQSRLNPPTRSTPGKVALLTYPHLMSNDDYTFEGIKVGARLLDVSGRGEAVQRDRVSAVNQPVRINGCLQPTVVLADGTKEAFDGHEPTATIGFNTPDSVWLWHLKYPFADILHPKPAGHAAEATVAVDALTKAGVGQECAAADVFVLNRGDNGFEGPNLQTTLEGLGDVVSRSTSIPASGLGGYDVVWVVMAYEALSPTEQSQLIQYVQGGGRLYLTGERPCCEALNQSIQPVINSLVRGGGVQVGGFGRDFFGPFSVNSNAAGQIANSPYRLTGFFPDGPGGMAGLGGVDGRNVLVTDGTTTFGGVWDSADMANGRGRLVVLMDIDWLKVAERSSYVVNVREFLSR